MILARRARGVRRGGAPAAAHPGLRVVDGVARRAADGVRGARGGMDRRRGGAAGARALEPAPRHPALGDPAQPQRDPPAPGPILNALSRLDPLPQIRGPVSRTWRRRSAAILRDPQVKRRASSVVRVLGTACGLNVEGSGWVAAPGVVVTNAHVVAGEDDTTVEAGGAPPLLDATPICFDPSNDVAMLRVPGLDAGRSTWRRARAAARPGGDPRLSRRTARTRRRAARLGDTADVLVPGRLRARAGLARDHIVPRPGEAGELRRPRRGRHGPGDHDRVRRDRRRKRAGRLRGPEQDRPPGAGTGLQPVGTGACAH